MKTLKNIFVLCLLFPAAGIVLAQEHKPRPKKKTNIQRIKAAIPEELKNPARKIKKMAEPVTEAVTKTAETAAKEVTEAAIQAHSLGGKILQGIINVMIAASPGKTRVYLPAPSSDPNSGVTVGVLPVFLFVDDKEVVRHILAPSLTYNKIFKANATFRYYWYPRPGSQFFTLASYALETDRRFTLRYEDPKFFRDWLYFKFDYTIHRDGANRFFGFGSDSQLGSQSNYTLRDNHLETIAGINFLEYFRFTLGHRFRFAEVVDGPIDSLPKISRFNPLPAGVDNPQTTMAQQVTLSYDSRDLAVAPIRGHYFQIYAEQAGRIGGEVKYERLGADLRGYYPFRNARFVTVWRGLVEGENGNDSVPLYEREWLGGKDTLRGFGEGRFIDNHKMMLTLEERIRFYTLKAFNVNIDFEVAPFYEAGTVYREQDKFRPADLHHVWGVGFRSIVRPNVVGDIEVGYSEQGVALFVGIDYPF